MMTDYTHALLSIVVCCVLIFSTQRTSCEAGHIEFEPLHSVDGSEVRGIYDLSYSGAFLLGSINVTSQVWRGAVSHAGSGFSLLPIDIPVNGDGLSAAFTVSNQGMVFGNIGRGFQPRVWQAQDDGSFHLLEDPLEGIAMTRVSADGNIAVGVLESVDVFQDKPAAWLGSDYELTELPIPAGFEFGQVKDITADGSVAVGSVQSSDLGERAVQWLLPELSVQFLDSTDETLRAALAVSPEGNAIGVALADGYALIREGERLQLPFKPIAISENGRTVVGVGDWELTDGRFVPKPSIWTEPTGPQLISTFLSESGIDIGGWEFDSRRFGTIVPNKPIDVSADGLTVAGTGKHEGTATAWIIRISNEPDISSGDCNDDGFLGIADLACIETIESRDIVLEALGTVPGDLDGNGDVALADFSVLSFNFGLDSPSYPDGNINLMDGIDLADFVVLATNFGVSSNDVAAVPEPNGVAVAWLGWLCSLFFGLRPKSIRPDVARRRVV